MDPGQPIQPHFSCGHTGVPASGGKWADPQCNGRACGARGSAPFGQHDVDFKHFVVALLFEPHLDVVGVDREVLGNHRNQILLQAGQEIRSGQACALVRDDELQSLFGDRVAGLYIGFVDDVRQL